jgi:hypothetical protein
MAAFRRHGATVKLLCAFAIMREFAEVCMSSVDGSGSKAVFDFETST